MSWKSRGLSVHIAPPLASAQAATASRSRAPWRVQWLGEARGERDLRGTERYRGVAREQLLLYGHFLCRARTSEPAYMTSRVTGRQSAPPEVYQLLHAAASCGSVWPVMSRKAWNTHFRVSASSDASSAKSSRRGTAVRR